MRKQISTLVLAAAVATTSSFAAFAGGLAPVEVAPTVFVDTEDDGSMGSLGSASPLLLLLLAGGAAYAISQAGDDDDDTASGTVSTGM